MYSHYVFWQGEIDDMEIIAPNLILPMGLSVLGCQGDECGKDHPVMPPGFRSPYLWHATAVIIA